MADEQASTLAFLQNFYTDVTLYMPFETHERASAVVMAEPAATPALVAAAAATRAAPTAAPKPPAPTVIAAAAPVPVVPSVAPVAMPVVAAVSPVSVAPPLPVSASKLPSLAGTGLAPVAKAAPVAALASAAAPIPPATEVPAYLLTTFATLGDNAQGVVILVRLPPERFIKLARNVFLNNLLKAIGLVMADVVLVNVESAYPVALQNLRKEIAATRILAFGKNLLDVAIRTTQIYEPVHFPTVGLDYIAGAEVEMIEYDVSLKKRLWAGLQLMFLR